MFKILDNVCTPTKGGEFSACVDLYVREDVVIGAGETVLVPLGVKIDLIKLKFKLQQDNDGLIFTEYDLQKFMKSHQLNLHIRSSMSAKHGLIIANGTGIIDLDYEDEIMICLHKPINKGDDFETGGHLIGFNDEDFGYKIKKADKIAQINLVEHKSYLFGVESKEKRDGGFGSTD